MRNRAQSRQTALRYSVAIGLFGACTFWFWSWHRPAPNYLSGNSAIFPAKIAAPLENQLAAATPAQSVQVDLSSAPAGRVAAKLDLIRSELSNWRALSANRHGNKDAEAEELNRLTRELPGMLANEDFPEILASLSADELDSPFGFTALSRWLVIDPASAARWTAQRPDAADDQAYLVSRKLLEIPASFESFSNAIPEGKWKQEFLANAGLAVMPLDPVLTADFAQRMAPDRVQKDLLVSLTGYWMTTDANAALDWISGVNDPSLRTTLISAAAGVSGEIDQKPVPAMCSRATDDELRLDQNRCAASGQK